MPRDIDSQKIYTDYPKILDILLYDNTTKKNIICIT